MAQNVSKYHRPHSEKVKKVSEFLWTSKEKIKHNFTIHSTLVSKLPATSIEEFTVFKVYGLYIVTDNIILIAMQRQ